MNESDILRTVLSVCLHVLVGWVYSPSSLDYRGPSMWLVPVSLVDLSPSHYYGWLMLWLLGNVLLSRIWMSVYSNRTIYAKVAIESRARIVRPVSR